LSSWYLLSLNPVKRTDAPMSTRRGEFVPDVDQKESEQRRDKLLLALLKTPPQPRPKRVRGMKVEKSKEKLD